ncbi:DUF3048 domain-containing protein [Modestobacter sp. VKM Ac-2986]|uniref:DUF3048 domain-containing protein n=1 Tax=Modestobacter sp. VKM Ac-2986 TaxID=3004140 RepID=UPI0022ABC1FD|nr:DUF3048 domain-containing protein [Modestobacter sp. VKM Ac-2986]MCZ2831087.1 DUF3048 domain-containing protein [Modestobacter sp. VKM Ac-2986]
MSRTAVLVGGRARRRPRAVGQDTGHRVRGSSSVLLAAVLLGAATSCGPADPAPVVTADRAPAAPQHALWPLTGLDSGTALPRPALALKIENSVAARPQTGLGAADLVWEEVVEGGITRFVAVYHSTLPVEVGPVRSVRPMDAAIVAPLHGVFAFSGGQPSFVDAVTEAGTQVLSSDSGATGFHRIDSRPAPHDLHAEPATLLVQADPRHSAAPPAQFEFAGVGNEPTAVAAGAPAGSLALTLSGVSHPTWTWSAPDGRWARAEGETPAVEADGTPLRTTNVVVLRTGSVDTGTTDPAGNPVPETVLVGSGEAVVATGGHTLTVTWVKNAVDQRLVLRGPDGNPVRLAPGNTWVELVPTDTGSVTVD